jgi:protein TonB
VGSHHGHGPSFGDMAGYLGYIRDGVGRHRRYPELAQNLGLEGDVEVRVFVNPDGTLARPPMLAASSGHDILDQEALRMVMRAAPFPSLPAGHHTVAALTVPVRFRLEN